MNEATRSSIRSTRAVGRRSEDERRDRPEDGLPSGATLDQKRADLRAILRELGSVGVAFSGGVDSALLLHEAQAELGARAVAFLAVSPSLAARERAEARATARTIGVELVELETREFDDDRYRRNDGARCFYCKTHLFAGLGDAAAARGLAAIVDGNNADDRGDYRPGLRAGREAGVRSPLMEANFGKADVRQLARDVGLTVWDKPAMPCLSSRIPYGDPVTAKKLAQIERAEGVLRDLGFRSVRVRHHGSVARVELPADEIATLASSPERARIEREIRAAGFDYVALDLAGFASGRLNAAIGHGVATKRAAQKTTENAIKDGSEMAEP